MTESLTRASSVTVKARIVDNTKQLDRFRDLAAKILTVSKDDIKAKPA